MAATLEPSPTTFAARLREARIGPRTDVDVTRQIVRNGVAYTLHDPIRFCSHQLTTFHYQIYSTLSEHRALKDVFASLVQKQVLQADHEEEFYQTVVHLNQLGLLDLPIQNGRTLYEKYKRRQQAQKANGLASWLFVKIPLFYPDAFLERTLPWIRPLVSRFAVSAWMVAVFCCVLLLMRRWREFTDPIENLMTSGNLLVLWLLLALLKVVHEFGHAYACKLFGGPVPDMGLFLMLGTPCAYVDASSAWTFSNRWQRIAVSLAGFHFESWVALSAFFYWCFAEPSHLRSLAHYTFFLSSLVTLGFNINPFMRYDGYYVLADLVNLPNLRSQALTYLTMFGKWVLFGVPPRATPHNRSTRLWLLVYGLIAKFYRWLVTLGILALVLSRLPRLGIPILIGVLVWYLVVLTKRSPHCLRESPELQGRRVRAWTVTSALAATFFLVLVGVPTPRFGRAPGLLERDQDFVIHAETNGFLETAFLAEGSRLSGGEVICRLVNSETDGLLEQQRAIVSMLQLDLHRQLENQDPLAAESVHRQFQQASEDLLHLELKQSRLSIRATSAGQLLETSRLNQPGQFVHRGTPLGRISRGNWMLRALVPEEVFSRTKLRIGDAVHVRLASIGGIRGRVTSIAQAGNSRIDDARLTQLAEGPIRVDAATMTAERPHFEVRIELPPDLTGALHGMRGSVSLPCEWERVGVDVTRIALRFWQRLRAAT